MEQGSMKLKPFFIAGYFFRFKVFEAKNIKNEVAIGFSGPILP